MIKATHNILILATLAILLFACQSKKNELQSYFFNPEDFDPPQVYVRELQNTNGIDTIYHLMERTAPGELKITEYTSDFTHSVTLVDSFAKDGVYLKEYSVRNQEGNLLRSNIRSGLIFSYTLKDSMDVCAETDLGPPHLIRLQIHHKTQFHTQNQDSLLHASGTMKSVFTTASDTLSYKISKSEIVYRKGKGIIKMVLHNDHEYEEIHYIKSISVDEFNELKKAFRANDALESPPPH